VVSKGFRASVVAGSRASVVEFRAAAAFRELAVGSRGVLVAAWEASEVD
jgi:hypothetical protein